MAATSSLQLRATSNFGTLSATGTTSCAPNTIIETVIGISGLLLVLTPTASNGAKLPPNFYWGFRGLRLCENGQAGIEAIWSDPAPAAVVRFPAPSLWSSFHPTTAIDTQGTPVAERSGTRRSYGETGTDLRRAPSPATCPATDLRYRADWSCFPFARLPLSADQPPPH